MIRIFDRKSIIGLVAMSFVMFAYACAENVEEGRFPVCKSNDDCLKNDAGLGGICWNLRCVECRYDTDCAAGSYCGEDQRCQVLSAPAVEDTGPKGWEPSNVDECMKACKDKECVESCTTRFPEKSKKPRRR